MSAYSFITTWEVNAPIKKVWDALYETESWPQWWRGVLAVKKLKEGDVLGVGAVHEYTWTSLLPYKLHFRLEVEETILHKKMHGIAKGELAGDGTWLFEEKNGKTIATNLWNVSTTKPWMNKLSFMLKPVFAINHRISMRWGADGLSKLLGCSVQMSHRTL